MQKISILLVFLKFLWKLWEWLKRLCVGAVQPNYWKDLSPISAWDRRHCVYHYFLIWR